MSNLFYNALRVYIEFMTQKINTAIIGYGFMGSSFFAPFLHLHQGYELAGTVERNTKKIKTDYEYVKSYGF